MEDVIKTIIALDEKARRQVDEAKNRRVFASQKIEEQRQKLKEEYGVKIKNAVDSEKAERARREEKVLAVLESENKEICARLDEQYRENGQRWAEELVKRTLE